MKTRKYHTPMNLLLESGMYVRIKMISRHFRLPLRAYPRSRPPNTSISLGGLQLTGRW